MTDFGLEAQKAAQAHLEACMSACYDDGGENILDSPASAPFCGCDTCIVREVLYAAWPFMLREQAAEIDRLDGEWKKALDSLNEKLKLVLSPDDVGAEQEDQDERGGDDRGHDVEP